MRLQRVRGPLLFVGITIIVAIIIERLTPTFGKAGVSAHYGMAFMWAFMVATLLWVALERANVIPETMRFRAWSDKKWNPPRTYKLLLGLLLLFGSLASIQLYRHSADFIIWLTIASGAATFLLFYWLYRMNLHLLVAGILCFLIGLVELTSVIIIVREMEWSIQIVLLIGCTLLIAGACFWAGIAAIRRWRNPGSWQGSWRTFVWGALIIFSIDITVAGVENGTIAASVPLSLYLFIYALGKFRSGARMHHPAAKVDEYTRVVSLKNFLSFTFADRWQWEESRRSVLKQGMTFATVTHGLFDVVAFVAVVLAVAFFGQASVVQQLSFAILAIVFHVSANLDEYHSATRDTAVQQQVRLEQELRTAHDMQMGLMPTGDPQISGFDISGICRPAEEVGGDYFDYVWLDEKKTRFGIAVADVSGKAMKAAITAVMTSGMVYREVGANATPKTILRKINRPMYLKTDRRVFTAMSFAVIDLRKKTMTFSNAGQMRPLLKRKGTVSSLQVGGAHLPLGMTEDVEYRELRVNLQKGDTLLFYTDGIPEAMNAADEMFGFERMESSLKVYTSDSPAKAVAAGIVERVAVYAGSAKQHDDMTVVVVRVL